MSAAVLTSTICRVTARTCTADQTPDHQLTTSSTLSLRARCLSSGASSSTTRTRIVASHQRGKLWEGLYPILSFEEASVKEAATLNWHYGVSHREQNQTGTGHPPRRFARHLALGDKSTPVLIGLTRALGLDCGVTDPAHDVLRVTSRATDSDQLKREFRIRGAEHQVVSSFGNICHGATPV